MRKTINIQDFLTGEAVMTQAFQKALDSLADGGGVLYFPRGKYVTGTVFLHSDITLYLDCGAEIAGSGDLADYREDHLGSIEAPSMSHCLIYAENCRNVEFLGSGTINGYGTNHKINRPMLMRFVECENVRFEGICLRDSAAWGVHMIACQNIHIHAITLDSQKCSNNDGFDFDSCRDIFISDSTIRTVDDSICLKSTRPTMGENLVVTNCILSSKTAVFKTGTSSLSGFKNVAIQNCVVQNCPMGTFKIICVDGGIVENISISNIVMDNVGSPLFIRLGKRNMKFDAPAEMDYVTAGQPNDDAPGIIRNISFSNIQANVTVTDIRKTPMMLSGLADSKIQNVRLSNVSVAFCGGGTEADRDIQVPEDEYRYPEQWFFGALPAYGLYARHVSGLKISNTDLTLSGQDARDVCYFEDVTLQPEQTF